MLKAIIRTLLFGLALYAWMLCAIELDLQTSEPMYWLSLGCFGIVGSWLASHID